MDDHPSALPAGADTALPHTAEVPATPPAPTEPPLLRWPLTFHGQGSEYFRIWIVNLALSIVTLGIYSAWAKVRRLKYFYGNTELAGARFDYTADPLRILKGRAIAFVFFAAYMALYALHPITAIIAGLLLWLALPWMIVRSLAFNLRYTRYRNVAFGFTGTAGGGYKHFLLLPLLLIPSLGMAFPYVHHQQRQFLLNNMRFGNQSFAMKPVIGPYFLIYLAAMGIAGGVMLMLIIMGAVIAAIGGGIVWATDWELPSWLIGVVAVGGIFLAYALFGMIYAIVMQTMRVALLNVTWSNTRVADCQIESKIALLGYIKLLCTRIPLLVITLGLATPWVVVTLTRYRLQHTALLAPNDLGGFEAAVASYGNVAGSEAGELFDLDLAL